MLTQAQNRLLTEVEGDAPMGRLMREQYWIPAALSATLIPDGAPKAVGLLGKRYVAFRATDGRIGFFDEACPHRGVSLVLARNEDCALRCIFHAWKFDVSGTVVEVPSEGPRSEAFAKSVKLNHYPTFEGGGLVWVYLGTGELPARPPLAFLDLPETNRWISRTITPCNWLQGVEGTLDSTHVGVLHQSWIGTPKGADGGSLSLTLSSHPVYETSDTAYGLRAAALRDLPDAQRYVRVTEYVMPFTSIVPGNGSRRTGSMFIAVPIDNVSHMLFWGLYDEDGSPDFMRAEPALRREELDIDNYANVRAGGEQTWRQNRAAMAEGHFTGFDRSLLEEDVVVQASMGPIVDRSIEHLCAGDLGLVRARQRLFRQLADFEKGECEALSADPVRPLDVVESREFDWRNA